MFTNNLAETIKTVLPKKHPIVRNNQFTWLVKNKEKKTINIPFRIADKKQINNT